MPVERRSCPRQALAVAGDCSGWRPRTGKRSGTSTRARSRSTGVPYTEDREFTAAELEGRAIQNGKRKWARLRRSDDAAGQLDHRPLTWEFADSSRDVCIAPRNR